MKTINKMRLTFESRSANEAFARGAVASFASVLDPTAGEIADIKTAVSEAVTNSIVHGYDDEIKNIYITCFIKENSTIIIKIKDRGKGIEDIETAMQPLYTTSPNDERAGLGFAVMESMMDKVKVISKKDKGTTVTLTKKILSKDNKLSETDGD